MIFSESGPLGHPPGPTNSGPGDKRTYRTTIDYRLAGLLGLFINIHVGTILLHCAMPCCPFPLTYFIAVDSRQYSGSPDNTMDHKCFLWTLSAPFHVLVVKMAPNYGCQTTQRKIGFNRSKRHFWIRVEFDGFICSVS